ncbi:ubiquitin-conjugating enzyme E2 J2-like [Planococcus citri]|uniref:ubiquitin-conjugating enzyme E2 J2-like n=1 Tax=Planococcus citri TaxID=170843 RepID=UPI0031F76247
MASQESKYSAFARLKQDYICLKKDPIPYIEAEPLPSNILEWYYVVRGPENTPYEGGYYLGKLVFPREYPFKPPGIYMLTPNGRFETRMRLCLSISDYHPEDWNPAWNVSTILTGLLSFMLDKSPTVGSVECSDNKRRALATKSLSTNLLDSTFCDLFPELVKKIKSELDGKKPKEETTTSRKRESQEMYSSDLESDSFSD